jgi:hypothetical protein
MIGTITIILPILQLILTAGNICVLGYALFKFLNKPHDTLETRVTILEAEIKDIKDSLLRGNDKFKEQEDANEVMIHSILALIEWEIQYCLTEHVEMSKGLEKAKDNLNNYLAKR